MTMPIEVKLKLERLTIEMAVTITGVHSVRMAGDDTVSAIFDIKPDPTGNGLHFEFPLPQLVNKNELREFSEWLAELGYAGMTVH
jgi:hypothetical protein